MNETNPKPPNSTLSPRAAEDDPFIDKKEKRKRPPLLNKMKFMSKSHSNIVDEKSKSALDEGLSPNTPKSSILDRMFSKKTKTEKFKEKERDVKGDSSKNNSETESEFKRRRFSMFNIRGRMTDNLSRSDKDGSRNQSISSSNRASIFKRDKSDDGNAASEEERPSPRRIRRNTDFTLEHLKLLKKQIENEKKILEEDLNQVLESEKKKKISDAEHSNEPGHHTMWSRKVKNNLLAFTRVKMLNDDLRLWGSSMNIVGLNPRDFEHVKKLMAEHQVENQKVMKKKKKFLLYPDDSFAHVWNLIYFIILIYTAFSTPYRVAFIDDLPSGLVILENITDGLFGFDMILTCFTAVQLENGQFIEDVKKLFFRYLTGWMIPDFIGIFPLQLFIQSNNSANDFFKFLRLPRLSRLLRLVKLVKTKKIKNNRLIDQIRDSLHFSAATIRIFNFLFLVIISLNFVGCMWYFVAKQENLGPGTWVYEAGLSFQDNITIYIASIYWAVTTLATVGFGDITPFNDYERMFAIAWMVIGVGIYSFTIGSLTSILGNQDTREGYLSAKLLLMDEFGKDTKLPKELRLKIKRTLEYNSVKNVFNQYERDEFFRDIPIDLKYEIAEIMHRGVIHKLSFFKGKDNVFIANIVPLLEPLKVAKGEIIYRTGEYPISVYFLISGRVNIVVGANMLNLKTYVQGCYFGEIEILNNTTRQSTIRAEYDCDLLTLNRKAFLRLMEDFPNYRDELRGIAEERRLRIGEALRKIKKILPISANSNFWNKKRETSLYDIALNNYPYAEDSVVDKYQSDDPGSDNQSPQNDYSTVVKSKFANLKKEDNGIPEAEKENEMDSRDNTRQEDFKHDEDTDSKLTNLIDPKDIDEEERKLTQFIEKSKRSRNEGFDFKGEEKPFSPSLTEYQIKQKIDIAEGTPSRPKSIFIVSRNSKFTEEMGNLSLTMEKKKSIESGENLKIKKPLSAAERKKSSKLMAPKIVKSYANSDEDVLDVSRRKSLPDSILKAKLEEDSNQSGSKPPKKSFLDKIFKRKMTGNNTNIEDKLSGDDKPLVLPESDDLATKERIDVIEIPVAIMINHIKEKLDPEEFKEAELEQQTAEPSPSIYPKRGDSKPLEDLVLDPSAYDKKAQPPIINLNLVKDSDLSDSKSERKNEYKILIHEPILKKKDSEHEIKSSQKNSISLHAQIFKDKFRDKGDSKEGSRKLTLDIQDKRSDSLFRKKKTSFQEDINPLKASRRESVTSVSSVESDKEVDKEKKGIEIIQEFKEKGWYNQLSQIGRPSRKTKQSDKRDSSKNPISDEKNPISQRSSQFRAKETNTPKKSILKVKKVESQVDDGRTVTKYKKKVKKLVETIKIMKKEFKKMQNEVNSVRDKLENFDKIVDAITDTLDKLNSQAFEKAEKYKRDGFLRPSTDVSYSRDLQVTNIDMPSTTKYLSDKKTIVFHFQKPLQSKVRNEQILDDNLDDVSTFMQSPSNIVTSIQSKISPTKKILIKPRQTQKLEESGGRINLTNSSTNSIKSPDLKNDMRNEDYGKNEDEKIIGQLEPES